MTRVRRWQALAVLGCVLVPLWVWSVTRAATVVIDGSVRLAVGSGGAWLSWSRRNAAGIIPLDLAATGPLASASFTSLNGYRGGGGMIPELSGTAYLGLKGLHWWPWTTGGRAIRIVFLPLWPAVLVAIPAWVVCWRAWRAVPPGHCPRCRYDLRALPTGGRCPECGHRARAADPAGA